MEKAFPTLKTERLVLRRLEASDAPLIQEYAGAYEVALNTTFIPHPYPDGAAEAFVRHTHEAFEKGEGFVFALALPATNALVGAMELGRDPLHNRAELGYWIGKPHWGRGFATEAALRLLRFGFEELQLNKITSSYYTRNHASARVQAKIGLRIEGMCREHILKWEEYVDLAVTGLLRSEWEQIREQI